MSFFARAVPYNVSNQAAAISSRRLRRAIGPFLRRYVHTGMFSQALELFNCMQFSCLRPNHAGILGALTACASLRSLDHGRWIHAYVDRNGMELDRVLGTALVYMYAKCGCIKIAWLVFESMPDKDVFAFTSLISGLANHGRSAYAIRRMGLVDEGLRIFNCMSVVYGNEPGVQHYGCLVDLLGRAGLLEEAKRLVREKPMEPDSYVLGVLLNSCRVHGDVEFGKEIVESLAARDLDHGGIHVLLSNMYASSNRWDRVVKVREEMGAKKVRKEPGVV
ncbi:Pentatricopeptide repeat protein isoform 2 [Hibiscus syriacus]|uniref:Pentatricopeptide repeat protein isoform 2 n=1 Tax=Hibiscus syriacus TaxID=106335 RepID=A0A6A2WKA8_HIBSY|nr:Pentatricopeptide repeat protein isoform 2 [Hibiscus syriacus]